MDSQEEMMKTFTRMTLPAFILLASAALAQAQPQPRSPGDDHQAHHPAGQAAQAQPAPGPAPQPGAGGMGMPGMGGHQDGMMGQGGMTMGCPMMRSGQGGNSAGMPMMQGMGQGSQGMMGNIGQGGMGGSMGMPFEHVEGRVAFLKAEIGITDAQQGAWNAFADAMRRNAETHRTMHRQMMGMEAAALDWQERLDRRARIMTARAEAMTALNAAAGPLFAALSEDQRQKAERLLSGPMGMM